MLRNVALTILVLVFTSLTTKVKAETEQFTYYPPGHFIKGSAAFKTSTGVEDYEVHAPDILFPIKAPAYANSQVYNPGGSGYKNTDHWWSNPVNFHYPWQDNFCEERSDRNHLANLCPSGWAHQGQDIRASTKDNAVYEVMAVEDSVVSWIALNPKGGGLSLDTHDGARRYVYLHMSVAKQVGDKMVGAIAYWKGKKFLKGQVIGYVSQIAKDPTPVHLHFELLIRKLNPDGTWLDDWGDGYVHVSPYWSLILAYERLIGEAGIMLDPFAVCVPLSERCEVGFLLPATDKKKDPRHAGTITCSADGTFETTAWCTGNICSTPTICSGGTNPPPSDLAMSMPRDMSLPPAPDMSIPPPSCGGLPFPKVTWTPKAPLVDPHLDLSSLAVSSNRLHIFGPNSTTSVHRSYDPATNAWMVMGPAPSGIVLPLIVASVRGTLYLFIASGVSPGVYQHQPDGSWSRVLASTFWLTLSGLATSSEYSTYLLTPSIRGYGQLRVFQPLANTWGILADRTEGIGSGAVLYNGDPHVFGGYGGTSAVSRFNIAGNTWTALAPLPRNIFSFAALARNSLIWIAGGSILQTDGGGMTVAVPTDDIFFYNPVANLWCASTVKLPAPVTTAFLYEVAGKLYLLSETGVLWEGVVE